MLSVIPLLWAGLVGAGLVWVFLEMERRGRPELVLAVVGGAVLLQALLYPSDANVPVGPFRPGPVRLPELLIGCALVARVLGRGAPARISATAMAWSSFFVWYALAAVVGHLEGRATQVILAQGRSIVYVGGCAVLAAGVRPGRLVTRRFLGSWFVGLGCVVAVMVVLSFSGVTPAVRLPMLAIPALGGLGADAVSLVTVIGAVGLLVEITREHPRRRVLLAAIPLLLAWPAGLQRASIVHFALLLGVLAAAAVGSTWSRRVRATTTELALLMAVVFAAAGLVSLANAPSGQVVPEALEQRFEQVVAGEGNLQSADARLNKYAEGNRLALERPLLGWGLAKESTSFFPGINGVGVFAATTVFDSVPYDLLVRTGAIGLLLFLIALALTMRDGWRAWVRHPDNAVAALALAALAGMIGLLGKAVVESVLDKVVLACALGVLIGVMAAAASDRTVDVADQLEAAQTH